MQNDRWTNKEYIIATIYQGVGKSFVTNVVENLFLIKAQNKIKW